MPNACLKGVTDSKLADDLWNDLNQAFYRRISARHDIALTSTELNGIFCIRFAVGSKLSMEEHVQRAFDLISEEGEATIAEWKQTIA